MFQLTRQEFDNLMSRIVTSSLGGVRKLPLAFTGQGVAMASSVLGSDRAIEVSHQIMRTFTHLRRLAEGHHELRRKIEDLETKYDRQFEVVFAALRQLPETDEKPPRKIGFTAKERQRGSAADRAVDFTPAARKRWDRLTPGLQAMFLANVWCRKCNGTTEMALGSGRIEKGQLVLHGNCAACGQTVARVIEQS